MNLNTVLTRLPYWYQAGMSIDLESAPGRGKSTTIEAAPKVIGEKLSKNLGLVVTNGANLTVMDVVGYGVPKHQDNRTVMVFSDPFFAITTEGKHWSEYDGGILFVDERDKMETDVKKILGEARLSGRFGPHKLPPGWLLWTAGNSSKHRSGSTKELDHEINRTLKIHITDDLESWNDWAAKNGVSALTLAFANQNVHIVFTDGVPEKQGPWCTPRSLCAADRYLQQFRDKDGFLPDDPTLVEEIQGIIGDGAAAQYFSFIRLEREMPKYSTIINDPDKAKFPEKPDAIMLVCYNLAHRVKKEEAAAVIRYVERGPKEFAVTFAKAACGRDPSLVQTPAFGKWAMQNSSLMAAIQKAA